MGGQSEEVRLPRREMVGDMGSIVFPASHVMVSWMRDIEQKNPGYWKKRTIVELGCGTGIVGLMAASYGAHVTLSDLKIYTQAIEENIEANTDIITGEAEARQIDWTEEVPEDLLNKAATVLVCDCVYYEASLDPLLRTISSLVMPTSEVILAYERRSDKIALYKEFFLKANSTFSVTEIGHQTLENGNEVFLYKMQI